MTVHHRLRLLTFPMRTARGTPQRPVMGPPGSRSTWSLRTCQCLRPRRADRALTLTRPFVLPSGRATPSASRDEVLSRLNGWPARPPADASPPPLRATAHGSGPVWFATPSLQRTFTSYSLPVLPAHQPGTHSHGLSLRPRPRASWACPNRASAGGSRCWTNDCGRQRGDQHRRLNLCWRRAASTA